MVLYNRSCPELFEITTRMEEEVEKLFFVTFMVNPSSAASILSN